MGLFILYRSRKNEKSDKEIFEEMLNDPRVNSKEVGEREGIKYFQVIKNGMTGFRNLDGQLSLSRNLRMERCFQKDFQQFQLVKSMDILMRKENMFCFYRK